jgi:ribosomal-protein-alanine N-acetyltransferase
MLKLNRVSLCEDAMGYWVRLMQTGDVPQATEIDREAFPTQWPPSSFKRELNHRSIRHLVVLEEDGNPYHRTKASEPKSEGKWQRLISSIRHLLKLKHSSSQEMQTNQNIVGYASTWLMVDEVHLTSIAVRQSHQRRGIGELLIITVINLAVQLNARVLTLEVRLSNSAAQALYEKYGFNRVSVRRGYYSDNNEDGVIMTTDRITSAPYQARFQQLKQAYTERWGAIKGFSLEELS